MTVEMLKKDAELLLKLAQKYMELLKNEAPKDRIKKVENYINSILASLETHVNENVKRYNKTIS